jgi:hypothetical protein
MSKKKPLQKLNAYKITKKVRSSLKKKEKRMSINLNINKK